MIDALVILLCLGLSFTAGTVVARIRMFADLDRIHKAANRNAQAALAQALRELGR